jgi:hypothetical protein
MLLRFEWGFGDFGRGRAAGIETVWEGFGEKVISVDQEVAFPSISRISIATERHLMDDNVSRLLARLLANG